MRCRREKKGLSQSLPADEIELLTRWVQTGASWPAGRTLDLYEATTDVRGGRDWWSLQPVQRPEQPVVKRVERVANPIDAFILARLEQADMEPASLADSRKLIRRRLLRRHWSPADVRRGRSFCG